MYQQGKDIGRVGTDDGKMFPNQQNIREGPLEYNYRKALYGEEDFERAKKDFQDALKRQEIVPDDGHINSI